MKKKFIKKYSEKLYCKLKKAYKSKDSKICYDEENSLIDLIYIIYDSLPLINFSKKNIYYLINDYLDYDYKNKEIDLEEFNALKNIYIYLAESASFIKKDLDVYKLTQILANITEYDTMIEKWESKNKIWRTL